MLAVPELTRLLLSLIVQVTVITPVEASRLSLNVTMLVSMDLLGFTVYKSSLQYAKGVNVHMN